MSKKTEVATTPTLTIPEEITQEWLQKHFTEETIGWYWVNVACYSRQAGQDYLQNAIANGNVIETPVEEVLTPAPEKPKTVKSRLKKVLGLKTA